MGDTWTRFMQTPDDGNQETVTLFGWRGTDADLHRKAAEGVKHVSNGLGMGRVEDLGLSADDGWVMEERPYLIPARVGDPEAQRVIHYMRAVPKRCHAVAVNHRTGQEIPMFTPEGGRLLCLALDAGASRDCMAYMEEKALRRERAALLREMCANALALSRRRQIPADVYESIRDLCRKGLDAKRQRDSAKS
ncbi:hypothetical protein psal_cds_1377 [Pandoravirus salinus]|uniref:Uncharacterized protein n=1 Tax=Pandoravirus salinus TaxID=1349410 RepID=S4VZI4_9VIRU|nr:hypothetical protein psal_cds_1377 [Pandoravirus salinus]AGO85783.1 hypothetical protein psal_cds_1377 [Pandoravirus salinus]